MNKNKEKQWYETLFESYGKRYDQEVFTRGTLGECDFGKVEIFAARLGEFSRNHSLTTEDFEILVMAKMRAL